jgi:outer membrane protein
MMFHRINMFCLVIFWALQVHAQPPRSITLAEAMEFGRANHLSVKRQHINIAEADERVKETIAIGIPKVNATINWQYFLQLPVSLVPAEFFGGKEGEFAEVAFGTRNNLSAGIEMRSLVADGTYLLGLKAARMYKEFARTQMPMVQKQVADAIQDAYLPAILIEENRKVLVKNIQNLKKVLSDTRAFHKEGFVEQLDVDRLELSLANLETELENLDKQAEIVYDALKFAIGYPMEQEIVASDELDKLLAETAGVEAAADAFDFSQRPEYQVLKENIALMDMRRQVTRMGYYPSISAFASYQYTGQGDNLFKSPVWTPTAVAGLQMNVPIFDGTEKKHTMERNRLASELAQNDLRQFERSVTLQLESAKKELERAQKRVANQEKNLALAEKIYKTTQVKFKEGVGSSIELSQAEQELYKAQGNLVNARYELLVAKMNIKKALR